ncbi:amidohydrolase family protein [Fodinibius sediminis]|uniref:Amidohydrolase-related domain-containing protein n=1 Tax=Fodinibius sediminis TaxID=1214077 RepID=A0A521CT99_9BACT|nr:amidohydrolase family protein [Fodinibius sediminis]SMO62707.1 hypothetical protein SAMN06265218_10778 [Fodinibius sediminis]
MSGIDRKQFLKNSALSAAGLMMGGTIAKASGSTSSAMSASDFDIMEEVNKYRMIDSHAHVYFRDQSPGMQIDFADRLGIEKLVISRPMSRGGDATPEDFRRCNNLVLDCVNQYPDRFIGQMTLNPKYKEESLEEIKRCTDQGMVGLKVYSHVNITDPAFYPIIEKFIDLDMIILMHHGIGRSRIEPAPSELDSVSVATDFAEISKRYPEAMFQLAHLGGGIDWEAACKAVKDCPNVYVDISGSNNDANIIDFALEYVGEDRMFFGCDNSFFQGVGHVLAAKLTERQREKIFFENYNNILKKSGNNVD